jgi:Fe2+ transport system protein B
MSLLSYLGSELTPICMVLARSPTLICTALASSVALKESDVGGMARLSGTEGTRGLSSLNSAMVTIVAASSMLSCSQSSAYYVLAFTMITPVGSGILSLR